MKERKSKKSPEAGKATKARKKGKTVVVRFTPAEASLLAQFRKMCKCKRIDHQMRIMMIGFAEQHIEIQKRYISRREFKYTEYKLPKLIDQMLEQISAEALREDHEVNIGFSATLLQKEQGGQIFGNEENPEEGRNPDAEDKPDEPSEPDSE